MVLIGQLLEDDLAGLVGVAAVGELGDHAQAHVLSHAAGVNVWKKRTEPVKNEKICLFLDQFLTHEPYRDWS